MLSVNGFATSQMNFSKRNCKQDFLPLNYIDPANNDLAVDLKEFSQDYKKYFSEHDLKSISPLFLAFNRQEKRTAEQRDLALVLDNLKPFLNKEYIENPTQSLLKIPVLDPFMEKVIQVSQNHQSGDFDQGLSTLIPNNIESVHLDWDEKMIEIFIESGIADQFIFYSLINPKTIASVEADLAHLEPRSTIQGPFEKIKNSANTVDQLIEDGKLAAVHLKLLIQSIASKKISMFNSPGNGDLLKSRKSINEKLIRFKSIGDSKEDALGNIEDIYRSTVVVSTMDDMKSALKLFQANAARFSLGYEMELMAYDKGFFGINAKLIFTSPEGRLTRGELQFHFEQMVTPMSQESESACALGHKLYEVFRLGAPKDLENRAVHGTSLLYLTVLHQIIEDSK